MLLTTMFLRVVFHLPRYTSVSNIFVLQHIPSFRVLRRKLVHSMFKRVMASSNSRINVNLNVHVYSPDIAIISADCTIYTPGIGTHSCPSTCGLNFFF